MKEQLVSFETAKLLKEVGFENLVELNYFYTNPRVRMFGLDEHGRAYPIKNISKKVYQVSLHSTANIDSIIEAPTQCLTQKWLRENKGIDIIINPLWVKGGNKVYTSAIYRLNIEFRSKEYSTFEEALEKGLIEALKLIKKD